MSRLLDRSFLVRVAVGFLAALVVPVAILPSARAAPLAVETYFKKADYTGTTLSPSGRYVARELVPEAVR
jgi:hypothetical protein